MVYKDENNIRVVLEAKWNGSRVEMSEVNTKRKYDFEKVPSSLMVIDYDVFNSIISDLEETHRLADQLQQQLNSLNNQNNTQLVLARNNESSLIRVQSENSNLQTQILSLQNQFADKERQIAWGITELQNSRNQLNSKDGQLTEKQTKIDELTQQLNSLQIGKNNKEAEINVLQEELEGSQNIDLRYKEKKMDELIRNLNLNRERVRSLREAYERLVRASGRENYNRENVNVAQNDIEDIKQELFQTNASVEDLHKVYSNCEKIAKLRVKLDQAHQQQFEARQQVPAPERNF